MKKLSPWYFSCLTGLLASGAALVVGEIAAGFDPNTPTIVQAYGEAVIDSSLLPNWLRDLSIDQLGQAQKGILVFAVTTIILLIGIGLGWLVGWLPKVKRLSHFRFHIAFFVISIFGILSGLVLARGIGSSVLYASLTSFFASATAFVILFFMIGIAESRYKPFDQQVTRQPQSEMRRNFLVGAGALTLTSVVGSFLARRLINFQRTQVSVNEAGTLLKNISSTRTIAPPTSGTLDHINGVAKFITPNDNFYLIDTALVKPFLSHADWSLKVTGMVEREIEISYLELIEMGLVEEMVTLSCISNEVGGDLVGNAIWRGVELKKILDLAGAQKENTQVVGRSVDNWTGGFPTQLVYQPDRIALVAVEMNGEPLPRIHGFPVRLVVSGLYGYVSATKWLTEIEIAPPDFEPYWIPRGWGKEGVIKTQSRIDVPRPGQSVVAGQNAIAGVAWAPYRGISKVEVNIASLDQSLASNNEWIPAQLSNDLTDNSWRQWHIIWTAQPGRYDIKVRATDGDGNTQTSELAPSIPTGATGWDTRRIRVS